MQKHIFSRTSVLVHFLLFLGVCVNYCCRKWGVSGTLNTNFSPLRMAMVSKCPSQMSGPCSGLGTFVGRGAGGGGGAPDLVPVVGKRFKSEMVSLEENQRLFILGFQHFSPCWNKNLGHLTVGWNSFFNPSLPSNRTNRWYEDGHTAANTS